MMRKYRQLLTYAARQRGRFGAIALVTVVSSMLAAGQPWPMKLVVDHVLNQKPLPGSINQLFAVAGWTPSATAILVVASVGILVLYALNSTLEVYLTTAWTRAGRQMVYELAGDLFARLQRRSLLFHSRNSTGDVMSRITGDSWCVHQVLDTVFFAPLHALLTMGMMVALMWQLDPILTLMAVAVAPLMVGSSLLVGKPLRAAAKLKREIESRIQAHIQQTLTGIPVVQAFVQEEREHDRFEQYANAAIRAQQRSTLLGSLNSLGSGLITTFGTGVVLWVGALHYLGGSLTLGGILVFIVYLTSLQTQFRTLAGLPTTLRGFSAGVDRVMEVLDAPEDLSSDAQALPVATLTGHVQLENVVFGYEPGRPVLKGLSFEALPGQTIALVGATGAGKTTLVNLLPRFFDPWEGRVLLDGIDARKLELRSLRGKISIMLQEPFLFPVSIAENIAYGRPNATRTEIETAAREAHAHDFIGQLEHGYDTILGERGGTLSGGERQRVAIARALLKNAPVLILDEPTSALDAETEHELMAGLERLMIGRTTFVIAHRLSTVRRAGVILVLDAGRIAESGTHEELLRHGGYYLRLYKSSLGREVLRANAV